MDGITDVRRQNALLKTGALQNAILTSANFSIIATDEKGIIQLFNVGAERMLGYTAAEVVNRISPSDIHDPQEVMARAQALSLELATPIAPGFEALAFKASRGIEDIYELTYICKDGSRFPAIVSITALRDDYGDIIGYLLIGTDNSVRKQVESELNEAMAAAEKANRAKTDFLSSMSHELRTPLNAILGFAQLMESGSPPPTPSQKRNLDQILKAGWYLLELINEILDLALIESGKLTLSREPVSLAEVMLECQAMIEPQAQKRGIGMTFPRFDIPYFVKADRTRVKQVLINLLFNAIKYNKPGGTVAVECTLSPPDSIRISVRDTGAGLAPEQLAQLFQPFNRLGKEASAEEGTGIGLVVTKRLVELMGGTIGVDSAVGVGSVFWIELNLTTAPQLAVREAERAALARPQVPDGTPLRTLLYVEDNPANLELVEQLIARRPDLRLLSAADGNLGIEFARAYQPDVILMDINLPGISGIEALKILRADPATAHIPIIALSANAMPRDIEKGLEAGFFHYLTKPIKVNEFMDALDVALNILANGIRPRSRQGSKHDDRRVRHSQRQHPDRRRSGGQRQPARANAARSRLHPRRLDDESARGLRAASQEPLRPDPARPADARHGRIPGDGRPQDQRRGRLPSGPRDHRPTRPQAARAAGRRQGFHQQAVRSGRSQDAHPQHAGSAAAVQEARELQQGAGTDGAGTDRRTARKRSPLSQPDRARLRLVLGAGRERELHQGFRPGPGDARNPGRRAGGRRTAALRWPAGTRRSGQLLQATIAARQPFLDFVFSRVNADGSQQKFQVSGEPMFNQSCRFIGYRGIGVELTAKN